MTEAILGHYTFGGTDETRVGQTLCEPGHYCIGGSRMPGPAGRYGTRAGASRAECDGPCPAGYFCPTASIEPRAHECGDAAVFCPLGSRTSIAVASGWYATGYGAADDAAQRDEALRRNTTHTSEALCPEGYFCAMGVARRTACPRGTFGGARGLKDANCSGPCEAGWYCPLPNATTPRQTRCGDPSVICPSGAYATTLVAAGHFSTSANGSAGDPDALRLAASRTDAALAIATSTPSTRTHEVQCEAGSYCVRGLRRLCPAGRWGGRAGETEPKCSGECAAGHYCPQGSTSPTQMRCGAADVFCPTSSPRPLAVLAGYYSVNPNGTAESAATIRNTTASCRENATAAECTVVYAHDAIHFPGATHVVGLDVRSAQRQCEPGHWCANGLRYECRPGVWGESPGLQSAECSALGVGRGGVVCPAGYFCPAASTSARAHVCGGQDVYCPTGSASPTPVTPGFYTVRGGANNSDPGATAAAEDAEASADSVLIRDSQTLCPSGHICSRGVKAPCSVGRYGTRVGVESTFASCEGPCDAGYWCEVASPSPRQHACGNNSWFCPIGSAAPIPAARGMYTVSAHADRKVSGAKAQLDAAHGASSYRDLAGELRSGNFEWDTNNLTAPNTRPSGVGNTTRVAQRPCEPGYFCSRGTRYQCPAGTFGNVDRVDAAGYDESRNGDSSDGLTVANQIIDAEARCQASEGHLCGIHAVDAPVPIAAHGSPFGAIASRRSDAKLAPSFVLSGRSEVTVHVESGVERTVTVIAPTVLFTNVATPVVWFFDEVRVIGACSSALIVRVIPRGPSFSNIAAALTLLFLAIVFIVVVAVFFFIIYCSRLSLSLSLSLSPSHTHTHTVSVVLSFADVREGANAALHKCMDSDRRADDCRRPLCRHLPAQSDRCGRQNRARLGYTQRPRACRGGQHC